MDLFLIAIIVIVAIALLLVNIYILVYFQHTDDKNTAYGPKVIVILGMLFAQGSVLLLPLDVANNTTVIGCDAGWNTTCKGLDLEAFWMIVFLSIILFLVLFLPFAIFYYETDDGDGNKSQNVLCEAIKMQVLLLIVVVLATTIMFSTMAETSIPIKTITNSANEMHTIVDSDKAGLSKSEIDAADSYYLNDEIRMKVSFPIYWTALIGFVGWFAFVVFAGIGVVALPMDLILAYVHKPKFIPADVHAKQKLLLQSRTAELLELGSTIKKQLSTSDIDKASMWTKRKQKKVNKLTMNKFKQSVYLLEEDIEDLKYCHSEYKHHNPLVPVLKLFLGILSTIISILWFLQIAIVMLPPNGELGSFLSEYFIWLDTWFPLFGTISVGVFCMYLLVAVVKGCFKFGMRCFCCALHPMKVNRTYMNSFLFNLGLVLLCCIPVVQFCDQAFASYTRLTSIQTIMGAQIRYLQFFSYFWAHNIFVYAFVGIAFITFLYLLMAPADRSTPVDELRAKIEKNMHRDNE